MPQLPRVVILGRPNVGKSTLFNRICGRRRALVGDEPGMTRDRLYAPAKWMGKPFEVIDTGGMIPAERDLIPSEIVRQAREEGLPVAAGLEPERAVAGGPAAGQGDDQIFIISYDGGEAAEILRRGLARVAARLKPGKRQR